MMSIPGHRFTKSTRSKPKANTSSIVLIVDVHAAHHRAREVSSGYFVKQLFFVFYSCVLFHFHLGALCHCSSQNHFCRRRRFSAANQSEHLAHCLERFPKSEVEEEWARVHPRQTSAANAFTRLRHGACAKEEDTKSK